VRFLRNYTLEQIEPFLKVAAYRRGVKVAISFCDYDAYQQEIVDDTSVLRTAPPDMVVLSLWPDGVRMRTVRGQFVTRFHHGAPMPVAFDLERSVPSYVCMNTLLPPFCYVNTTDTSLELSRANGRIQERAASDDRVLLATSRALPAPRSR